LISLILLLTSFSGKEKVFLVTFTIICLINFPY
jgi:hypothetical protein